MDPFRKKYTEHSLCVLAASCFQKWTILVQPTQLLSQVHLSVASGPFMVLASLS